jgi:hypothetical protein
MQGMNYRHLKLICAIVLIVAAIAKIPRAYQSPSAGDLVFAAACAAVSLTLLRDMKHRDLQLVCAVVMLSAAGSKIVRAYYSPTILGPIFAVAFAAVSLKLLREWWIHRSPA